MSREEKLNISGIIVFAGFVLSLIYHLAMHYTGHGYPFDTYLFNPQDRFADFMGLVGMNDKWDPFHTINSGIW